MSVTLSDMPGICQGQPIHRVRLKLSVTGASGARTSVRCPCRVEISGSSGLKSALLTDSFNRTPINLASSQVQNHGMRIVEFSDENGLIFVVKFRAADFTTAGIVPVDHPGGEIQRRHAGAGLAAEKRLLPRIRASP